MFRILQKLILAISVCSIIATPSQAMFIQPDWLDPTQQGVGTNRYSYSFNDPINNHDPNGNYCLPCIPPAVEGLKWLGVGIIGAIGLGVATNQSRPNVPASDRIVTGRHNGGPQLDPTPPDPVGPTLAALAAAGYAVSRERVSELGADPNKGFDPMEATHGVRYEETFGVELTRSTHEGADFIVSGTGHTIDAMGPFPSEHFTMRSVSRSLDRHLRKSVDRVSVDGTGLTPSQRDALRENIYNRPREERDRIDTIGLD